VKKQRVFFCFFYKVMLPVILFGLFSIPGETKGNMEVPGALEKKVTALMEKGNIPGLSLVILREGKPDYIKGFGYADISKKTPVTAESLFEIGSCSKAFTALAALVLEQEGLINLDAPVTMYVPWFQPTYENKPYPITLRHLLHHTSGLPLDSIRYVPLGNDTDALEQTVRNLKNIELKEIPGTTYQYVTVNYDILGYAMEVATKLKYETYMEKYVFSPLGLTDTTVGMDRVPPDKAVNKTTGYKISFFKPRRYDAPAYRGNSPAGYVVTDGKDMARWLKHQMGILESPLSPLIQKSHARNDMVPLSQAEMASYAAGWLVSLSGSGRIFHGGYNPNYMSYIILDVRSKTAVAVMTNSNSDYSSYIANKVINTLLGITPKKEHEPYSGLDRATSVVSIILFFFCIVVFIYILSIFWGLIKGWRQYESFTSKKLLKLVGGGLFLLPFLFGINLLPMVLGGVTWETALAWAPISLKTAVILLLFGMVAGYVGTILSSIFPQKNKYLKSLPMLIMLSILSGIANAIVIFLINGALYAGDRLIYMIYYFGLAMLLYLLGRKVIQTRLMHITYNIVYDMRMSLIEKIFYTSYQKFEKMDRGRVFATLNDDTGQIGTSATVFVTLVSNMITVVGCFVYLSTIAFWATLVTVSVIILIAVLYSIVSQRARAFLEAARDTRDAYMRELNGLIDGFKELSLHLIKRKEYRADLERTTDEFRNKTIVGMNKFVNAFMIGESMLIAILGSVGFAIPKLFPSIQIFTLTSFIMILLYLIGPINGILSQIPHMMQLKVAWDRVKKFQKDIPANISPEEIEALNVNVKEVNHIQAKGVVFEYEGESEDKGFTVGPIDFEAKKGEIVFVIGGNGSGKTTLAKLLTGLYIPHGGSIFMDGKEIKNFQLGEYFSTVFSNYYLFEKLYNIDLKEKKPEAEEYLKVLHLDKKVSINDNAFSTIDLSGGQRKRLALLQCYLENSPVYLFDELAADQDPEFRKFFYRELLVKMKEKGKIVIAITHDDHYFDVADKVIKMDMGKVDVITEGKTQLMLTR